jgi:hypothetical protein
MDMSGGIHTPVALPTEQEVEWAPGLVWTFWKRKYLLSLDRFVCPLAPSLNRIYYPRQSARTRDQQHCYHHAPTVKPEAAIAVVELLMMGVRTPETC